MTQMDLFGGKMKKASQAQLILNHLEMKGSISAQDALLQYRIYRLAARNKDLRDRGYEIETDMKQDTLGKSYARYVLG